MNIGIISLEGRSSKEIAKSCKKYFDKVDALNLKEFEVHLTGEGVEVTYQGKPLGDYDCLYIRGSYRYALLQRAITRLLGRNIYMPISKLGFALGHDKFLTLVELQKYQIAIPKTYYAATTELAKLLLTKKISYPIIMNVPRGTHGKGVMIADSEKSAKSILDLLEHFNEPYIIQEFIFTENTTDVRAVVAGGRVIAAYEGKAMKGEARANIHLGGERRTHKITKEEEKLAIGAARAIGADICGVDILNAKKPAVIEVNLSPSIAKLEKVTGVDVSDEIAKFLYEQTLRFHKKKESRKNGRYRKKAKKIIDNILNRF